MLWIPPMTGWRKRDDRIRQRRTDRLQPGHRHSGAIPARVVSSSMSGEAAVGGAGQYRGERFDYRDQHIHGVGSRLKLLELTVPR